MQQIGDCGFATSVTIAVVHPFGINNDPSTHDVEDMLCIDLVFSKYF